MPEINMTYNKYKYKYNLVTIWWRNSYTQKIISSLGWANYFLLILFGDLLFLQYLAIPTLWPFSNNQTRFANQCSDSGTGVAIHTLQRTLDCRAVARNDDNFIVIIANIFSFHSKLAGKVLQSLLGVCLIAFHATSFLYFYGYVWWHYVIMIKFHHHGCPSLSHWTQSVGITKHLW